MLQICDWIYHGSWLWLDHSRTCSDLNHLTACLPIETVISASSQVFFFFFFLVFYKFSGFTRIKLQPSSHQVWTAGFSWLKKSIRSMMRCWHHHSLKKFNFGSFRIDSLLTHICCTRYMAWDTLDNFLKNCFLLALLH